MAGSAAFSWRSFDGGAFVADEAAPRVAFSGAFARAAFVSRGLPPSGVRAFAGGAFARAAFNAMDNAPLVEVPGVDVTFVGLYPVPGLSVEIGYVSGAARPLVGTFRSPFEQATPVEPGWQTSMRGAARVRGVVRSAFEQGVPVDIGASSGWEDAQRFAGDAAGRYQRALRMPPLGAVSSWQEGLHQLRAVASRSQRGVRLPELFSRIAFQQGVATRSSKRGAYEEALPVRVGASFFFQIGRRLVQIETARYQDAIPARAGVSEHPVNPPGPVDPEPGETVVVPVRRAYLVQNSIVLTRVDGGELIPASSFAMSIDADSWTWQWSATLPGSALPLVASADGQPVDVIASINGVAYRLCVERFSRERRFAKSDVRVSGRGRAAILDAPYSPVLNHVGDSDMTIAQLLEKVLTINGSGIGWSVEFGIEDWFVPGGTWALQGTYIAGLLDIAGAAGAIIQPHRTDAAVRILPRYPAAPWAWADVTPDFQLPAAAVAVEAIEWIDRPAYNRVFALGTTSAGVAGQVTRAGTAGDQLAPQVTHSLMTDVVGVRQRGLPELANTGRQAQVALRLQVLPETGVIVPGQFVRYVDGSESRLGLVRSTSLDWQRPSLRQSITLETHLAEA
ncbi:hypothetical protein DBA29_17295 [Xenophilus aerolatus]|nr:hypothetical protein [Xenophilus aerolatus]